MDYYHGATIEGLTQLKPCDTSTSNIILNVRSALMSGAFFAIFLD